jgi:hypothetical protein
MGSVCAKNNFLKETPMSHVKTLITLSLLAGLSAPVLAFDVDAARAEKKANGAYNEDNSGVVYVTTDAFCDGAIPISNGSSVAGSNVGATNYVGNVSGDVLYMLMVPSAAEVTLSTCNSSSPWDAYMRLYNGCPTAGGAQLFSSDDVCSMMPRIVANLSAGTYYVVMEGYSANTGSYQLDVSMVSTADPCDGYNPTPMTFTDGHYHGSFNLADGMNVYDGAGLDMAYTFTLTAPTSFFMDACRPGTSGLDSDSFILTGTCGGFTQVSYVDGNSSCQYAAWATYQDFGCGNTNVLPAGTYTLLFNEYYGNNTGTVEFDAYVGTCGQSVDANEQPLAFSLSQAVPNPFNPSTTISYSVAETAMASLTVYDLAGHAVATLVDGMVEAGSHSVVFDGSQLASGVYFYTLQSGASVQSQKMVLVK